MARPSCLIQALRHEIFLGGARFWKLGHKFFATNSVSMRFSLCFRLEFLTTSTLFFQVLDIFVTLLYELDVNSYLAHFKNICMDFASPPSFFRNKNKRKKIRKNKTVYFQGNKRFRWISDLSKNFNASK